MFNPETSTYQVTASKRGNRSPISVEPTPYDGKSYDKARDAVVLLDFLRSEIPSLTAGAVTDLLVSMDTRYTNPLQARINSDRFTGHNAEVNVANARDYLGPKFEDRPDTWVSLDSNPPEDPQDSA